MICVVQIGLLAVFELPVFANFVCGFEFGSGGFVLDVDCSGTVRFIEELSQARIGFETGDAEELDFGQ